MKDTINTLQYNTPIAADARQKYTEDIGELN